MRQGRRAKLSVTVDPHLYAVVERHAERTKLPREGYRKNAREDLTDAEAYLAALDELIAGRPRR